MMNVRYRDVRVLVPFILQIWMYCSVIVSFAQLREKLADWGDAVYLYGLNPMAGVVEGFRWCLMHNVEGATVEPPWTLLAMGVPVSLLLFLGGLLYFKRVENQFADIV